MKASGTGLKLKRLRESLRPPLSTQAVADHIGIPKSTYASKEDKKKGPFSVDFIREIAPIFIRHGATKQQLYQLAGITSVGVEASDDIPINESETDSSDDHTVAEVNARASAGAGAVVDFEGPTYKWLFPMTWLRAELSARPAELKVLTIEGDSMVSDPPQRRDLEPGDKVLVNISDTTPVPPGVFVVNEGHMGLVAKRVQHIQGSEPPRVRLTSNNLRYDPYEVTMEEARIVGRIVIRLERL